MCVSVPPQNKVVALLSRLVGGLISGAFGFQLWRAAKRKIMAIFVLLATPPAYAFADAVSGIIDAQQVRRHPNPGQLLMTGVNPFVMSPLPINKAHKVLCGKQSVTL